MAQVSSLAPAWWSTASFELLGVNDQDRLTLQAEAQVVVALVGQVLAVAEVGEVAEAEVGAR